MTTILSLDPGGTTGVAFFSFDEASVELNKVEQVKDGLEGFIAWYLELDTPVDVIVCESFTLRPGVHGVNLSPTYIIGALEALSRGKVIVYQEAKLKPLCDDARLKKMGLFQSGLGHANDAVRHGIIYLRNKKHAPTLEKGWR
jgi:hypothetical protein